MQRHGPPFCTALGFLVAFIVLCVLTVPAHAAGQGNVNFILGQKALDEDDWTPPDLDTQRESGVEVTWGGESWPIQIATDFLASLPFIILSLNVEVALQQFDDWQIGRRFAM